MTHFVPFTMKHLEAACRVHRTRPYRTQIGRLLQEIGLSDPCQTMTKWKRLFKALASAQNRYRVGNHLIMLINHATRDPGGFRWCLDELNVVLLFSGLYVRKHGRVAFLTNG
ncbi:hypothetical protein [Cupriavidus necator]